MILMMTPNEKNASIGKRKWRRWRQKWKRAKANSSRGTSLVIECNDDDSEEVSSLPVKKPKRKKVQATKSTP